MTKYLTTTAIALALGLSAATTNATANEFFENTGAQDKQFYVNFSYGQLEFEDTNFDVDANAYAFTGGVQINPYLATEATFSWHDYDDITANTVTADFDGDGFSLEWLVVASPIEYRLRPIAMLGVMYIEAEIDSIGSVNIRSADNDVDETDIVWGVGMDFDITDQIGFRAIYKGTGNEIDSTGWFVGPTIRF